MQELKKQFSFGCFFFGGVWLLFLFLLLVHMSSMECQQKQNTTLQINACIWTAIKSMKVSCEKTCNESKETQGEEEWWELERKTVKLLLSAFKFSFFYIFVSFLFQLLIIVCFEKAFYEQQITRRASKLKLLWFSLHYILRVNERSEPRRSIRSRRRRKILNKSRKGSNIYKVKYKLNNVIWVRAWMFNNGRVFKARPNICR